MNVERKVKRNQRLVILKRIYEIEFANCRRCPRRGDQTRKYCCAKCPVFKELNTCGSELLLLSFKEPDPRPKFVRPVRTEPRKKKDSEHYMVFTRNAYIKDRAAGLNCDDFTEKYDIGLNTLKRYVRTWGLQRLTREKAKNLLMKMEDAQ